MTSLVAKTEPRREIISGSDRVGIMGQTGSGKTYLVERLVAPLKRLVVADPKGMLKGKWGLTDWNNEQRDRVLSGEYVRTRVPHPLDGNWEPYLWTIYEAGGITLYLDEVYGVAGVGSKPSDALNALYTRGREFNIGVWGAMQRPSWVPLVCISECSWYIVFRLMWPNDRKRVAPLVGEEALNIPKDEHGFYLRNVHWNYPKYFTKVRSIDAVVAKEPAPPKLFQLRKGRR